LPVQHIKGAPRPGIDDKIAVFAGNKVVAFVTGQVDPVGGTKSCGRTLK